MIIALWIVQVLLDWHSSGRDTVTAFALNK